MDKKPSIVIVEDHPVMRDSLAAYFTSTGRWQIAGTASNLKDAKKLLSSVQADILLLDIQLKDGWGLDIVPYINEQNISKKPVTAVYSAFDDYAHVSAAISMGVKTYVTKSRSLQELENALKIALYGGSYIDEEAQSKYQIVTDKLSLLTKRETEILTLVKQKLSNKEIAAKLDISLRTIENILSCVYNKTGIRSRYELELL